MWANYYFLPTFIPEDVFDECEVKWKIVGTSAPRSEVSLSLRCIFVQWEAVLKIMIKTLSPLPPAVFSNKTFSIVSILQKDFVDTEIKCGISKIFLGKIFSHFCRDEKTQS